MPRPNPRLESAVEAARGPFFEASVVVIPPAGEIRVFYQHPNPTGGYYDCEHSMPVVNMTQFELRSKCFAKEYGLEGVRITRVDAIDTTPSNGEAEYYEKYGTAGEF